MFSKDMDREVKEFSAGAMNLLMNHDWPGNVRELENVVHRAVILASDETFARPTWSTYSKPNPWTDMNVPRTSEELKSPSRRLPGKNQWKLSRNYSSWVRSKEIDWSVTASAEQTGMQRTNFQALMKKYDIHIRGAARPGEVSR